MQHLLSVFDSRELKDRIDENHRMTENEDNIVKGGWKNGRAYLSSKYNDDNNYACNKNDNDGKMLSLSIPFFYNL
jgi:hypothetical protein